MSGADLSIRTAWDNEEKTSILVTYKQPWDWKDFEAAQAEINSMMGSTDQLVNLIFDVRQGGAPPPGAMIRFRAVVQSQHPNRGAIIFVGGAMMVQTFLNLIVRIFGKTVNDPNFVFANSLEEARSLIALRRKR